MYYIIISTIVRGQDVGYQRDRILTDNLLLVNGCLSYVLCLKFIYYHFAM